MPVSPIADYPLRKLVLFLRDEMNTRSQAVTGKSAVEGVREFQTDLNTVDRFPLLMVYRTRYTGRDLATSSLTVEYFVQNPVEIEDQPGYLNWAMRTLGELLADYTDAEPDACLQIPAGGIEGEVRFGQAQPGGLYIPFVRITVSGVAELE